MEKCEEKVFHFTAELGAMSEEFFSMSESTWIMQSTQKQHLDDF